MTKTHIILSISVLINIFLVGYLTGMQLHHREHHEHHSTHGHEHGPKEHFNKELHHEVRVKRHELFQIMKAPEFSEVDFDAKVAEIQKLHDELQTQIPAALKKKMLGKTQKQRIKVVKRIKHRHRHRL